ncbi:MAG: heparan-alpha-glucosaminide N-acetyltransferase [Oscillospiraceae bacterium]
MIKKDMTNRIHLIDEVRGFAIICMVVYHLFYDLVFIFDVDIPIFFSPILEVIVNIFIALFVFISGSACNFSKSNIKRGAICFSFGLAMTLFTFLFMKDELIVFGILHMLGICMIIYGLLSKFIDKIPPLVTISIFALLFFFTFNIPNGYIGFGSLTLFLPRQLYETNFLFPLGFVSDSFYSADYFALFPWFFMFLCGSGFGKLLKNRNMPEVFYKSHIKPLAFIGSHTLWIYVLHQPILVALLYIVFKIIR